VISADAGVPAAVARPILVARREGGCSRFARTAAANRILLPERSR